MCASRLKLYASFVACVQENPYGSQRSLTYHLHARSSPDAVFSRSTILFFVCQSTSGPESAPDGPLRRISRISAASVRIQHHEQAGVHSRPVNAPEIVSFCMVIPVSYVRVECGPHSGSPHQNSHLFRFSLSVNIPFFGFFSSSNRQKRPFSRVSSGKSSAVHTESVSKRHDLLETNQKDVIFIRGKRLRHFRNDSARPEQDPSRTAI